MTQTLNCEARLAFVAAPHLYLILMRQDESLRVVCAIMVFYQTEASGSRVRGRLSWHE